ncbi:MAG TPA: glycosyltransferase family 1 protein [Gemmatimonadota bacterium]|nr:glycosyltransferase family 1 protein [Gemmatimonadota bacterium]
MIDEAAAGHPDLSDIPCVVVARRTSGREVPASDERRSVSEMWRTGRALSRFDAIVFPTHTAYVPVSPGSRVVLVVHDAIRDSRLSWVGESRAADLRWRAKRWLACRQASVIATTTRASAAAIRRHLPIGKTPIAILGMGVAPSFSPDPKAEDHGLAGAWVPEGRRFLLYVGGLGEHKRVPMLVRAFGRVAADPALVDLLLVLAGAEEGSGAERGALERALEALGPLRSRVIRTGFVPDPTLAALYRRASCLVLPSRVEGFGLPALEAMASGAPVVAARIPSLEEVCGEAAEYFDDQDLPGALAGILGDGKRRRELARRGIARSALFGWDEAARRLLAALSSP